ncbi:MAG: GNAT family N-acetyltransferase [Candidatus Omnitrophota bacterium]|jgi:CelD/BcsL family acetyltransferase involved in cellulose biosynthesis
MEIKRISKEEDFLKLKDCWNSLLFKSNLGNIFLTWEWLYNWWQVFKGSRDKLFILVGMDNDEVVGIAPCYINGRFYKKIRFLGSGIVCSEYLSFIANSEKMVTFCAGVCEYLSTNSDKWDLLYLESLEVDNITAFFLKNSVNTIKWKWLQLREHSCFYLPLSSIDKLKQTMSPSLLKNALTGEKRLSLKGQVVSKELDLNCQELSLNFDIVVSLHQNRWQNKGHKSAGVFSNKLMLQFLRKITEEFYKNGWLSIYCILFNGKPIAADYNFKFQNKIWIYVRGLDSSYRYYTPGLICLWESLQFYIKSGYREYDFLRGDEVYKNKATGALHKEMDMLIMKSNLKCFLFLVYISSIAILKKILKKMFSPRVYLYLKTLKFNRSR